MPMRATVLPTAATSEPSATVPPAPSPATGSAVWDGPERRDGISKLEQGSVTLSHAVQYLVSEQLQGRRSPVQANREAIAILSKACIELGSLERREPARKAFSAKFGEFFELA